MLVQRLAVIWMEPKQTAASRDKAQHKEGA